MKCPLRHNILWMIEGFPSHSSPLFYHPNAYLASHGGILFAPGVVFSNFTFIKQGTHRQYTRCK